MGTCYRKRQCSDITGGYTSGTCASKLGVCCIVQLRCGTSSSLNNTYFVNTGFPAPTYASTSCMHTIKRCNSNICQVRIDFLTLTLAQPSADGNCATDAINIVGGASTIPPLCGENSGQHIYLNFNGDADINIIITTSSSATIARSWNIKIAQIACDCPTVAPAGCLMYYNSGSGTIKSFNYGITASSNLKANGLPGSREIANLRYGVCIGTQPGFCSIRWTQSSGDPYSFTVTGNTIGLAVNPGLPADPLRGSSCTTDFIVVPNPSGIDADRFCGNSLPTLTCKYTFF
ncbi:CUB domain-containing protein [Oryctes borbonicus]|uniref:CUB domain-containing protein n=1 Tax=Oryctes borbonicus TaxID=1629725 RepID=A0A0T6B249_9SCAR|nr:CUB domain-containing protein [Oryctes borbonicus]